MKLKYPVHFEVVRVGYSYLEYLTSAGDWRPTSGFGAAKPKKFRSHNRALAAAQKNDASLLVYWLEEGGACEYNRLTLRGKVLLPDQVRYLPDIVKTMIP